MTVNMFLILFIILSTISSLVTEAIKIAFKNANKTPSANLIAIIDGLVVGGGGMVAAFIWLSIAFTPASITAIIAMALGIALGSMVGYDKVIQLLEQIKFKEEK